MELLSRLVKKPVSPPFLAIPPHSERLEAQCKVLCEEFSRFWKRLLAREIKLAAKMSKVKVKEAEFRTSLDASAARVRCLEEKLARFNAAQAEETQNAARLIAADKSVRLDVLLRMVIVLNQTSKESQAEIYR